MMSSSELNKNGADNPAFSKGPEDKGETSLNEIKVPCSEKSTSESENYAFTEASEDTKEVPQESVDHVADIESGQSGSQQTMNKLTKMLMKAREFLSRIQRDHGRILNFTLLGIFVLIYLIYLIALFHSMITSRREIEWCQGQGFVIIVTLFVLIISLYYMVLKRYCRAFMKKSCLEPIGYRWKSLKRRPIVGWAIYIILFAIVALFLIIDSLDDLGRLRSGLGLIVLILVGFIFSKDPSKVIWSQIWWGVGLQFVFGLMVLRWDFGRSVFDCLGNRTNTFLGFTNIGASFVYGPELVAKKYLYFQALSVIFFFSFVVQILHYYGIMQILVKKVGWLLYVTIGTTACESMNAAANIFLGQSEAPLMIKPYIFKMTNSELHAVMTGGFATIAGAVLAAYIAFGVNASHLLGASVMSAPAALAYSKLFYPETGVSVTKAKDIKIQKGEEKNFLDAASRGACNSIMMVLCITANLIAFTAAVHFVNALVKWLFVQVDIQGVDFVWLLARIFYPIAYLMGVPEERCLLVGELLGYKTVVNEFVAYQRYGNLIDEGLVLDPRTEAIVVYSLCGFSNLTSIGIQIAALGKMAPSRENDLAKVAFRAFLSGCAACFMTACIAGMLVRT